MRSFLRHLAVWAMAVAALALLSPWLIYEAALQGIEGRPVRPARLASSEEQVAVWKLARGSGPLHVAPSNPYAYLWKLTSTPSADSEPGETLAYWVSREHIWAQPQRGGMGNWHLSNAVLTIWLTRHWSAEELASYMVPIASKWPPSTRRPDAAGAAAFQP